MNRQTFAGMAFACFALAVATHAAAAALDLLPAPGGSPIHLRISQTTAGLNGPQTTTSDIVLRRTGPATAVLQQSTDVSPLIIGADGSLRVDPAAPSANDPGLADLLAALSIAHGVTGVAGAGDRSGWNAPIPLPQRSPPPGGLAAPTASPSPAAPLMLPVRAIAAGGSGEFDIDGSVETSLAPPESTQTHRSQRPRGGGFGGFGGMGGRGGFGGSRGGGDSPGDGGPRGPSAPPITLDLHIAGHIAHNALAHLLIVQTRRVVLDGLTYNNVGTATIDVMR